MAKLHTLEKRTYYVVKNGEMTLAPEKPGKNDTVFLLGAEGAQVEMVVAEKLGLVKKAAAPAENKAGKKGEDK